MHNSSSHFIITIAVSAITSVLCTILVIQVLPHAFLPVSVGTNTTPTTSQLTNPAEQDIVSVVKSATPAVVSITITKKVSVGNSSSNYFDFFSNGLFNFGPSSGTGSEGGATQEQQVGGGSGFLVSADGLIVTNKHVVDDTTATYTVYTNDGKEHTAKVVAEDPILDLAFIKIDGSGYPYLSLGDSSNLQVGQTAIAIGNALGEFSNTVSVGVVSGLSRSIVAGDYSGNTEALDEVIQTDAAINPGNSGGPLLDLTGRVVGVNVAIVSGSQNIGFALPINTIKSSLDSVQKTGKIVRPFIGVRYVLIDSQIQQENHLSINYGALVSRGGNAGDLAVIPGSPADKAGIVPNDIILEADGSKITSQSSLSKAIQNKKVGDTVTLKILHQGKEKTVTVTLEEYK